MLSKTHLTTKAEIITIVYFYNFCLQVLRIECFNKMLFF